MDDKVKTFEEAIKVVEEVGLLPLSTLIPGYPSLNSITAPEDWHSNTDFDPWIWRTKFSTEGVAGYGKFIRKKSMLVSRQLLPYVKKIFGHDETVEERYFNGNVSREALDLYNIISQEEGIDTRVLRAKAGLKESDKKKLFDNALVELQGTMDIVISGIKEKRNAEGEKNGWSSTAYETYDSWAERNSIKDISIEKEEALEYLLAHFSSICSKEAVIKLEKIFNK